MTNILTFSEPEIQALFGHEAAEDEELERLRQYYFKSNIFDQVITDVSLRILVGHKGIGKSAMFQIAMAEDAEKDRLSLLIKPDDVVDLKTDSSDFLKTIRDWKKGLSEIIVKKIFTSLGANTNDWVSRLSSYGGKLIDFLTDTIKEQKLISLAVPTQLTIREFLKSRKICVYVDDLDRGWQGTKSDVNRISALMNAVRDLSTENRGILFRISLRSDVYYLFRTSDESTDKIEGSVIWLKWTNHEIFVLLVKRIETFFGRSVDERSLLSKHQLQLASHLSPIMELSFKGSGHWENAPIHRVLMSLIRKRPRDLVKLCTLAARNARENNQKLIGTKNFESIFAQYSQGRLQDTINEFRSELPDLDRLLLNMKPSKKRRTATLAYVYSTDQLLRKIDDVCEMGQFRFANNRVASRKELAAFMYKINFLTARKETETGIDRHYFEENRYLSSEFADFGYDWEIHPAYRWALQPDRQSDIFSSLELSREE